MRPRELFNWSELCRCNVPSDEEKMYDHEEELDLPGNRRARTLKVLGSLESDD